MNRIIVTGGLGFIGSHFVNYVLDNTDDEILIIDNFSYAANVNNIKHDVPILNKDICDVNESDLGDYDYIVNFAAESHVDNSIKNGLPFIKSNVFGVFNLLEVAKKNKNIKKFLQISTDEVYGDVVNNKNFSLETDILNPSSYYSSSKASADLIVISANKTYGLPYLITRTCNNYGENQNDEKFLPKIIKSIKNNNTIPVYGNGNQIREWIYVGDNVKSIYKLLISNEKNDIFNIGSEERYTNNELIKLIGNILDRKVNFQYVVDRLGHDKKYSLDSKKYTNIFGDISSINLGNWLKIHLNKI